VEKMATNPSTDLTPLLRFYQWAGVDIALMEEPLDRFAKIEKTQIPSTLLVNSLSASKQLKKNNNQNTTTKNLTTTAIIETARINVQQAANLDELRQLLLDYQGCSLKFTAKNTCFADGTPGRALMLIGEAPGNEEDMEGLPFAGRSKILLTNILKAIGLTYDQAYFANIIPWRPPGNRQPSAMEIDLCRPFILRQIELADPRIIIALGATATSFLTGQTNILKVRGQWQTHQTTNGGTIAVMPTLHPISLLRTPTQKKFVWQDFLQIKQRLDTLNQE